MASLEAWELSRYSRQLILPGFGASAQTVLREARVLVIGAGGLGCPAVQYLASAGVGHLTVLDADVVEASNLARQILHTDARIGMNKAQSIAEAVRTYVAHLIQSEPSHHGPCAMRSADPRERRVVGCAARRDPGLHGQCHDALPRF